MTRSIAALAALFALAACHPASDDVAPSDERNAASQDAPTQAKRITIDADGLSRESIHELAEHIEGLGEIASAKVKVAQDDQGHTAVHVEVAGHDLPTDDYLMGEIKSFEGLADAAVVVESVHPDDVAPDPVYGDDTKTPEQIKAEVTEKLRKEGVEGDIQVEVHDEGDGERRVEVRVEKKGDGPAPSDLAPSQAD